MSGAGFSVTQCLNIAAAYESWVSITERWETAKGDVAELRKQADEAREEEGKAVQDAKDAHGDAWPPEVCETIAELNGKANAVFEEHKAAKSKRDSLGKQAAQLLKRWGDVTKAAIEGGDMFGGTGARVAGNAGDAWKTVDLANVCGDLLAETFAAADPCIRTVGEFCEVGKSGSFARLIEEGAIPPSIARQVADSVRDHLERNKLKRNYPKRIDATIAEFMGKASEPESNEADAEREEDLAGTYADE